MAAVKVREREWMPTAPNRRAPEPHPDADPDMTRAARAARAAWRLEYPDAWRRELESLGHFDPAFIYDVAHDYAPDWTTDPDYGAEVHLVEYDEDGVLSPSEKRAWKIQERMSYSATAALADTNRVTDREADYELEVRFRPETIAHANRVTRERHPVQKGVRADLVVLATLSARERARFLPKGILRLDLGAPVPELVLEVMSRGSAGRDLDYKRHLYEDAGVYEYLIYDLGGKRWVDSPRELLMYRLEGGTYRRIAPEPQRSDADPDMYWSDVFGTRIRFLPDAREETEEFHRRPEEARPPPRFQWWDAGRGRWRDRETDEEYERERERERHNRKLRETRTSSLKEGEARGEVRGREAERTNQAIVALHVFLGEELAPADLIRIETVWRRSGPPKDVMDRIKTVQQTPSEWRSLLPNESDGDNDPGRIPPPREPGPPRDG